MGQEGASERGLGRKVVSGEKVGLSVQVGHPGPSQRSAQTRHNLGLGGVWGQALYVGDAATALLAVTKPVGGQQQDPGKLLETVWMDVFVLTTLPRASQVP